MMKNYIRRYRNFVTSLTLLSLAACGGGGGDEPTNTEPVIGSLQATPNSTDTSTPVVFSWTISDADGNNLTCLLDINDDGTVEYTINNCDDSTQSHTYNAEGSYNARLTINDGNGGSANQILSINITNNPQRPMVNSFTVTPTPGYTNSANTFNWNVSDPNSDMLTCSLDINDDGTVEYTINNCAENTSQNHTYSIAGNYTARLSVDDGNGGTDEQTITLITINEPLSVEVTVDETSVASGERVMYSVTFGNLSPTPVDNIGMSFPVPTGLSFHQIIDVEPNVSTGCSSTCLPSQTANWALGSLRSGETITIHVNALVANNQINGDLLSTPITISATGLNDLVINKDLEINNTPLAEVTLNASTDPIVPDEEFTYTISVGNISAGTLTSLQMRTLLPNGVSVVSVSDGGSEVTSGEVVWNVNSLNVQSGLTRTVTVVADATLLAGQVLMAETRLTHTAGGVENVVEHALTVVDTALPLNVDIVAVESPVVSNTHSQYNVTLSNPTDLPVDGISVVLRVPDELSFHQIIDTEPNISSGCSSSCLPRQEARWDVGTLSPGASQTININALVNITKPNGTLIAVPFRVESTGQNDTIELLKVTQIGIPLADVAMSASKDPVMPGESYYYTIDIGNVSAGTLTNLEARTFLPAGVNVDSISHAGTQVSDSGEPVEIVWDITNLGVGNTLQRKVMVTADNTLQSGQIISSTTKLKYDDGQEVDNVVEHAMTVVDNALPLNVAIAVVESPIVANTYSRYNVTLSNPSNLPVDGISLLLRLPPELRFHQILDAEPNVNAPGCSSSCLPRQEARWDVGTIEPGESYTININALVNNSMPDGRLISVPFRIESTGQNDTIDLLKVISVGTPLADVSMSTPSDPVIPGEVFTYRIDIGNVSAGTLTNIEARTILPAGLNVQSISNGGVEVAPGEVVWASSSLNVASTIQHSIDVVVDNSLSGGEALLAHTELRHDGGMELDRETEHVVNVVASSSPLSVAISANPNAVVAGGASIYTITVTNNSELPADAVEVVLRLPAELSFHSILDVTPDVTSGCSSSCLPKQEAHFSLGTIPAGASQDIIIDTNVGNSFTGGTLIVAPVRVTATGLDDSIELEHIVPIL